MNRKGRNEVDEEQWDEEEDNEKEPLNTMMKYIIMNHWGEEKEEENQKNQKKDG